MTPTPDSAEPKPKSDNKKLLLRMREEYKRDVEADQTNRKRAMEAIKFARVKGEQWVSTVKKERGNDRLMLEDNKTNVMCKRVINEMRANRPQGKVRGYEDNDKETAEVQEGLARNIWNASAGDSVSDYQAEYQVMGGFGAWEIVTDYSSDTAFDQDILVKNLPNPFCLWSDANAKDMLKQDAMHWFKENKFSKEAFKAKWGNADQISFEDNEFDDEDDWTDDEHIRVVEYWYKVPATKTIALLNDGKSVDVEKDKPNPAMIVRQREVKCHKIMVAICSGDAVLEGPTEWAGSKFPFVPVYGDYLLIDGKIIWGGMVENLMDIQRAFNDAITSITETISSASQDFDWVTATQANGMAASWAEAQRKNFKWKVYNVDPMAPGPPIRAPGANVPVALIQAAQIYSEEINSIAGFMFDPNAAENSNSSGRALNARARQGQIATFNYPDNMAKAMRLTWEILLDLIPKIYDTERSIRILGADGAEKFVRVNAPGPDGKVMNDLSRGKYDVTVTVGPSYATQRQEATEVFSEIGRAVPQIWGVAGDLIMKNMDVPGSDAIAKRLEFMLPPPIQQTLGEGKEMPPEVQRAMAQVDQMQQVVAEQGKMVEAAAQEAEQVKSEAIKQQSGADKAKSEVQIALANLKTEEANFKAMQAEFEARVATAKAELQTLAAGIQTQEAGLTTRESEVNHGEQQSQMVEAAAQAAMDNIQQAAMALQAQTDAFLEQAANVVTEATLERAPPKAVGTQMKRVDGKLVGVITYEDGSQKQVEASRDVDGSLMGNIMNPDGTARTIRVQRNGGDIIGTMQ